MDHIQGVVELTHQIDSVFLKTEVSRPCERGKPKLVYDCECLRIVQDEEVASQVCGQVEIVEQVHRVGMGSLLSRMVRLNVRILGVCLVGQLLVGVSIGLDIFQ